MSELFGTIVSEKELSNKNGHTRLVATFYPLILLVVRGRMCCERVVWLHCLSQTELLVN